MFKPRGPAVPPSTFAWAALSRAALLILLTSVCCAARAATASGMTGPTPAWVEAVEVPMPAMKALVSASSASSADSADSASPTFLLVDRQTRVAGQAFAIYRHLAMRVQRESQLSEASEISLDFDPAYQHLTLHHVRVRRGDTVIDKLPTATIQLLQRERDLEARVLDGRKTAHMVLADVRMGDVVEYDYSIEGRNPALANARYGRCDLQYSEAVELVRCRLLWPEGRDLFVRSFNGASEGRQTPVQGGGREYIWERRHQPALKIENDAPEWFDPYPRVEWSDSPDWRHVIHWALPLYAHADAAMGAELRRERDALMKADTSPEARVAAALRLVQGKVRYLGIEMGAGSYAPRDPDLVFSRRFGDCKDKALLLAVLLRSMGIEAYPALVNTRARQVLADALPSPVQFDHVIVKVRLGSRSYWLDPTRASQYGPLHTISQADFRQALVIDPKATGLETIPRPANDAAKRRMALSIDATAGVGKPAPLTVRSTYAGQAADRMRSMIANQGREDLQKQYLNFYLGNYPGTSVAAPMEVQDSLQNNELVTVEHYTLPELWHKPHDDRRVQATIFSAELLDFVKASGQGHRGSPLRLDFPLDVEVSTEMLLPRDWGGKPSEQAIAGPGFEFKSRVQWPRGDRVLVVESFKTLSDEVPAGDVVQYNQQINKVRDSIGYRLFDVGGAAPTDSGVNWVVMVLLVGLVGAAGRLAWRLHRWDPEPQRPAGPGLRGLGGWLVLVVIGIVASLVKTVATIGQVAPAYSLDGWSALTSPGGARYQPLWAPALIFEMVGITGLLALTLLMLALFFGRRSSFPRLMIWFMWAMAIYSGVDNLLIERLAPTEDTWKAWSPMVHAMLSSAIWTAYLLRSERVANTFVERRQAKEHQLPGKPEPAQPERVDAAEALAD